jgi:hypothetical protein
VSLIDWFENIEGNRLAWHQRVLMIGAGLLLLALLGVAAYLPPDPRGFGTHQGLGLPPCTFRQLTGLRCPSCGMTTSWSCLMRGKIVESFQANSGGAVLGLTCVVLAPWILLSGLRGRWLGRELGPFAAMILTMTLLAVTLADWLIREFLIPS